MSLCVQRKRGNQARGYQRKMRLPRDGEEEPKDSSDPPWTDSTATKLTGRGEVPGCVWLAADPWRFGAFLQAMRGDRGQPWSWIFPCLYNPCPVTCWQITLQKRHTFKHLHSQDERGGTPTVVKRKESWLIAKEDHREAGLESRHLCEEFSSRAVEQWWRKLSIFNITLNISSWYDDIFVNVYKE